MDAIDERLAVLDNLEWRFVTLALANGQPCRWPAILSDTRGLIVHPSMGGLGWMVTHERSGLFIDGFDSLGEALLLAARLAAAGDWTRSGQAIKGDLAMVAKAQKIRRYTPTAAFETNSHQSYNEWLAR